MASWQPQPGGLEEILQVIRDSTNVEDKEIQKEITLRLNAFTNVPDYICYLVHILTHIRSEQEQIRTIAGYLLKNNTRSILKSTPEAAAYVKSSILHAFNDPSPLVRNAAGQVIVSLLGILEPSGWPEALGQLMANLESTSYELQETAFNILDKACEDFPRKFDVEINGNRPLDFMIPKFISLTEHPVSKIRAHAVSCLANFVPISTQSLWVHLDMFIAALFKVAADPDPAVRRNVCSALVLLLASRPERLMPEIGNVAEYMLYSTQDKNEAVALEACEFWLTFAEDPELQGHLQPLLPKVAPILLQSMVYGEDDLLWLDEDDDAAVPDKETDIKPRHYGSKGHGLERQEDPNAPSDASKPKYNAGHGLDDADDFDDEEEDDDFLDDDDMSTDWNLRKCAAAALDVLAVRFGDELLQVLLPHLKERLWSTDWLQRESGILALGALAEGCIESIEPHLNTLIPYLINMLNDGKPLVRSITCWTLGRYASWCTQPVSEEHRRQFFIPTMEGLLRMVLDNNKRVQEAGCSAFATLEEDAGTELAPFLEPVLRNLVHAFDKYQQKNLLILYDAVGTLADAVGPALQDPAYLEILMAPMTKKWTKLKNEDEDLIPLLECLASIAVAAGQSFAPWAQPVFERCYSIVHESLMQYARYQSNPQMEEPDKAFIVVALDLLSGLVQGHGMAIQPFIAQSNPPLLNLVAACLKHHEAPVRQSGYALIGDMAMTCFTLLRPFLPQIMPLLIAQLENEPKFEFISACNNAAWSAGEIALHFGPDPEFQQWVPPLIQRLGMILLNPKSPKSLSENAAVTIGRVGYVQPELVAPSLDGFAQAWCQALLDIKDNEEKDSAFRGFCRLIQVNPGGIVKHFLWFCNAVVRWTTPSEELNDMFRKILTGFKEMSGAQWDEQLNHFPPAITERLRQRYQL